MTAPVATEVALRASTDSTWQPRLPDPAVTTDRTSTVSPAPGAASTIRSAGSSDTMSGSNSAPVAATRLRTTMAAVRLAFTWMGVRRTLAAAERSTAARAFAADSRLVSASKLILDQKHPAYRAVARVRSEAAGHWRRVSLPYPEPGIRLLPQEQVGQFTETMTGYRNRLQAAVADLARHYDQIQAEARQRLGGLYNPADYPPTLEGLFDLEWSFPAVEPPGYLLRLHPGAFAAEQDRVRARFESAVQLAEQAFAAELQQLVTHLAERLSGRRDGRPKVFRDTAIENMREFCQRFRRLNIRSNTELDTLVTDVEQVIAGLSPQQLRQSSRLRQGVAEEFQQIQQTLGGLLLDRPRRAILRRQRTGSRVNDQAAAAPGGGPA